MQVRTPYNTSACNNFKENILLYASPLELISDFVSVCICLTVSAYIRITHLQMPDSRHSMISER